MRCLLALSLVASCALPGEATGPAHPNIVIILADDLGYNDVSWHNAIMKTPALAALRDLPAVSESKFLRIASAVADF